MKTDDTARTYYNSARTELIERIKLRDQIFVFYLAGIVAIFGLALGASNREDILLFVPFIGLGASIIISQHFAVIGALAAYCVLEVGPFLRSGRSAEDAPQWDASGALKAYHDAAIAMRTWGHVLLILLPSVCALGVTWHRGIYSPFPLGTLWWIGFGCVLISGFVMWRTHRFRSTLYERISSQEPNKAPEPTTTSVTSPAAQEPRQP
ncbi:MAG TPA: hypothetical protein VHC20_06605 [Candidatus Paceibacterota bacterium]|nr:hypothetical protein [Candidatus Paceibacterota bacterium]